MDTFDTYEILDNFENNASNSMYVIGNCTFGYQISLFIYLYVLFKS
jgi:hypothetical protein